MTLLSTGFLVDLLRRDAAALDALRRLERGSAALRVPAVAYADLWEAAARSRHPPRDLDRLDALLSGYPVAPVDAGVARRAGRLAAEHRLPLRDALAAATAVEAREPLVARDVRAFERVPELRLVPY